MRVDCYEIGRLVGKRRGLVLGAVLGVVVALVLVVALGAVFYRRNCGVGYRYEVRDNLPAAPATIIVCRVRQ